MKTHVFVQKSINYIKTHFRKSIFCTQWMIKRLRGNITYYKKFCKKRFQFNLWLFLLLQCECEEEYCMEAKQRIDVCRPLVMNGAANATSSCSLSQLICQADAQCATALQYYHQFCRSMFRGRKCSNKCLNSIEILRKQEKAAALTVCQCDGNEDYDCPKMQTNLARLCFHKHKNHTKPHERGHGEKHRKVSNEEVHPSGSNCLMLSGFLILLCAALLGFTW